MSEEEYSEFPFNPFKCPECDSEDTIFGVGSDGKNAFFECLECGYEWPEVDPTAEEDEE